MINRKHQDSSRLNPSYTNVHIHVKGLNIPTTSSNSELKSKREMHASHKNHIIIKNKQNGRKEADVNRLYQGTLKGHFIITRRHDALNASSPNTSCRTHKAHTDSTFWTPDPDSS